MADQTLISRLRDTFSPSAIGGSALVVLLLASLIIMSDATSGSARFGELFSVLLVINVLGLLGLAALIGWNLHRLIRQVRTRQPGARLTARVVFIFVLLAITPVLVVYYFSLDFLHRGIDSWFDVRVDKALEDSLELGRTALGVRMRELLKQTETIATDLGSVDDADLPNALEDARRHLDATELTVLGDSQILAFSNIEPTAIVPTSLDETIQQQLRQSGSYISLDPIGSKGLYVRVALFIPSDLPTTEPRVLTGLFPFTERMSSLADSVQTAYAQYRELAYLRKPLKVGFTLTLSLVLALSLLAAVWAALGSARRMVAPLRDLAEGTVAVASGEFGTRLPPSSSDEVGFLVDSFNEMTSRLAQARDETRRIQARVEEQRTYLEVVLARLSSGVITLDQDLRIYTANQAAEQILDLDVQEPSGKSFSDLVDDHPYLNALASELTEQLGSHDKPADALHDWRAEIVFTGPRGRRTLMFSGTALTAPDGVFSGHVLVFDDVTELVRAQRTAAWSEVARRLAHEIKNPLTPIQLSTERLRHKYLPMEGGDEGRLLDRMTATIAAQVDAMKSMVNAFSDYARSPQMLYERVDFNQLVNDVVELYHGDASGALVNVDLDPDLVEMHIDKTRIRQVVHNLVKNACEASATGVTDEPHAAKSVRVQTSMSQERNESYVELKVIDQGPGIKPELLDHVFEPYVTSKPKGTGLGLAVVKKIAEEHGGTAWAENAPAGGAVFVMKLPIRQQPPDKANS